MTDSKTATELLPCPICGGEMSIALHSNEFDEYWWTVQRGHNDATACKCRMFVESDAKFCVDDDESAREMPWPLELRKRLVEKWNTRTPEQAIAATLGSEREKALEALVQKALDECWCDEWWYEDARKLGMEANY